MTTLPGSTPNPIRRLLAPLLVLVLALPAFAQEATPPKDSSADTKPEKAAPAEETVQLSPFEVRAEKEGGYFTANTLAGTRLNNNIADLPGSITVVTKQQLEDTASLNINDVFRYEANTEGASTYTPITLVRGNVADVLGNNPVVSGNRVRGLNSADLEMDNFFALSRIPFDSYNTQSLEIDRGPNSILYGTGSPAGIVNQERIKAELNKESGSVSFQVMNNGGYRDTAGLNIPLIKDKLSIYVAQAYTSVGFKQEPSYDISRREYAAFTLVPFKNHKTKLTGSFEYYNNSANDPNQVTPVDFVTTWRQSGQPMYNPINNMVTYTTTGRTVGPYALATTSPDYAGILQTALTTATSPYFVPSLTYAGAHWIQFVESDNTVSGFYKQQQTGFSVAGWVPATLTPAQARVNEEKMTWSTSLPVPAAYQTWQAPSVTSKSVYDWSSININAMSLAQTNAKTFHLDLQQEILPNLNLDVGWFRQEMKQFTDQPVSQSNATTIYVDTNSYLLNGAPNPHAGQPFIDAYQNDVFQSPETNNNMRASLAYELDLASKVPNWLKFLGHHRFMAVVSQHDDVQNNLRFRESIVAGDPNYLPTTAAFNAATGYGFGNANNALEQWFYLGNSGTANGYGVSAPGTNSRPPINGVSTGTISTYNYATGVWQTSTVGMQSVLYPTGGLQQNVQDEKTYFWQSFFFDDRLVGTLGINQAKIKNRQNVFPATNPLLTEYTNGFPNTQAWKNYGPWTYNSGRTRTTGAVLHPFKDWKSIDSAANSGNLFYGFLRTLSLTYNDSGNFNPPPAAYTDFFGNPLGKPMGTEKDYGIEIATPDNKFFLRATWFKTTNQNQLVSNTSNARALYIDAVELKNWATAVVEVRNGESPSDPNFGNTNVYPITSAMQDQIAAITGLPYTFGGNVGPTGQFMNPYETQNGIARGAELELTYNPTQNWRMKFSWGKQKTILSDIANQAATWIAYRQPTWLTYKAADLSGVYTKANGTQMSLSNFWTGYGYDSNIFQGNINGWNTTQDYYNIVVAGQLATDRALNNTQATNQRQYTWSYVSTYDFDRGKLKGLTVGGAVRYLGEAVAGYYGDTTNLNTSGLIFQPDVNKPIMAPAEYHLDAWVAYQFKMPWSNGRITGRVQLNVSDLNIGERLQAVTFNYDGSPAAQRIIQGRTYSLSTKFSF